MSYRNLWSEQPPVDAEVFGTLKIQRINSDVLIAGQRSSYPQAKIWKGKSLKPMHYSFTSVEKREAWIAEQKKDDAVDTAYKNKRKEDKKIAAVKTREQYQVGQILVTSGGYDQTNVNFYQIIERPSEAIAIVQEISAEPIPGTQGFMCEHVKPVRNAFMGKPMRKVIGPYGISGLGFGSANIYTDDSSHYSSWYA